MVERYGMASQESERGGYLDAPLSTWSLTTLTALITLSNKNPSMPTLRGFRMYEPVVATDSQTETTRMRRDERC